MKKILMIFAILALSTNFLNARSLNVEYCKSYADFVADRWSSVDSLTQGRTNQMCRLRFENDQYKLKTGDKEVDNFLKKEVLAIKYDGHIYVNCRNLRCNDVVLEPSNFVQAYRYDGNKLCVVAHWTNTAAFLAGVAGDILSITAPLPVAVPSFAVSTGLWLGMEKMSNYRCYVLESEANAKGKFAVTRITDEQMEKTLAGSPKLLERYKAVDKKLVRQSASNILPVLIEKGLITE